MIADVVVSAAGAALDRLVYNEVGCGSWGLRHGRGGGAGCRLCVRAYANVLPGSLSGGGAEDRSGEAGKSDDRVVDPERRTKKARLACVQVQPNWEAGRVRWIIPLTPVRGPPSCKLLVLDGRGGEIASAHVVECFDTEMDLTLRFSRPIGGGGYRGCSLLGFPDQEPVDRSQVSFALADPPDVGPRRASA